MWKFDTSLWVGHRATIIDMHPLGLFLKFPVLSKGDPWSMKEGSTFTHLSLSISPCGQYPISLRNWSSRGTSPPNAWYITVVGGLSLCQHTSFFWCVRLPGLYRFGPFLLGGCFNLILYGVSLNYVLFSGGWVWPHGILSVLGLRPTDVFVLSDI